MTKFSALALAASLALAPMAGYASAATSPAKPTVTTTHHTTKKKVAETCKMEKGKDGKSHKVCTPVKPVAHKTTTTKKVVKKV